MFMSILAKLPEISIPGGGNIIGTMRKKKTNPLSISTKKRNTMECCPILILKFYTASKTAFQDKLLKGFVSGDVRRIF